MTTPAPAGYRLGWLFVVTRALAAISQLESLGTEPLLPDIVAIGALMNTVLAAAAVRRSPWAWHVLLGGLLVAFASHGYYAVRYVPTFGWPPLWSLAVTALLWPIELLYFSYFYRRRAMFGAVRRWRWVERLAPSILTPESVTPR